MLVLKVDLLKQQDMYHKPAAAALLVSKRKYDIIILVNEKSCRLRMGTYRDGIKRKGGKIGMEL